MKLIPFFQLILSLSLLLGLRSVLGATSVPEFLEEEKYYNISQVTAIELIRNRIRSNMIPFRGPAFPQNPSYLPYDRFNREGRVISVARDLVALGEEVYQLVIKGKPTNVTSYTPVSVIPRQNGVDVDILDTENWIMPERKVFQITYENFYGMKVVDFTYSVYFSYNGSYEGKGAYLTSVQIVPEKISTLFGFDFTATMKVGGIVNQGTSEDPIAGLSLLMEHTISTIVKTQNMTDTFFINGLGEFKKY